MTFDICKCPDIFDPSCQEFADMWSPCIQICWLNFRI